MRIYVASSWRNDEYPRVVACLRSEGHEVFDFRENGFDWRHVDPHFSKVMAGPQFLAALEGDRQEEAFVRDMSALIDCDAVVLVAPCGKSAHLELGWACGANKRTIALLTPHLEPELMYKMVDRLCLTTASVVKALEDFEGADHKPTGAEE